MSKKETNSTEKKKGKLKKILLIILLIIVVPIIVFFGYRFISNKLDEAKTNKMSGVINDINKEKVSYVFVEINPSLVMTIKDDKVENISCLNDDCMTIYNELNVKGKNINESIDIIYNKSKEKGFDTSKGVKLSSSDTINVEKKDYITIEYIDITKEKELLNEVKNNEDIKNVDNGSYYNKLWEELKKDSGYDNVYSCSMNDNKELECHFTNEFLNKGPKVNGDKIDYGCNSESSCERLENDMTKDVINTFKKFDIKTDKDSVIIDTMNYSYRMVDEGSSNYVNVLYRSVSESVSVPQKLCDYGYYAPSKNGKCEAENVTEYRIPLDKINLVKPSMSLVSQIVKKSSSSENIDKALEQFNKDNG